jgi:hypothetical protein
MAIESDIVVSQQQDCYKGGMAIFMKGILNNH